MRNTLTIHESSDTLPPSTLSGGFVDLGTRKDYHYVYNDNIWQQVSGIPFIRVDTDMKLSGQDVMFLLSRVRGDEGIPPSGGRICIWRCTWGKKTVLAIGCEQIDLLNDDNKISNKQLGDWVDRMLKEQF
mgnify:CR=1 FL=1